MDLPGLTLAVNTAEEVLQLALGGPSGLLLARQWDAAGTFAELLMPGLEAMLQELGRTPRDIARIACVAGPGSFTGLRIGLASAQGLASGLDVPTAGLDNLALLARGHVAGQGTLAVITHSRTRQIYFQAFACPKGEPLDIMGKGPLALTLEQCRDALKGLPSPVRALGTGLRRNQEFFAELAEAMDLTLLPAAAERPAPETLLQMACQAEYGPEPLDAVYLRPSDAEENLDSIAAKRGLDPAEARKRLDLARTGTHAVPTDGQG